MTWKTLRDAEAGGAGDEPMRFSFEGAGVFIWLSSASFSHPDRWVMDCHELDLYMVEIGSKDRMTAEHAKDAAIRKAAIAALKKARDFHVAADTLNKEAAPDDADLSGGAGQETTARPTIIPRYHWARLFAFILICLIILLMLGVVSIAYVDTVWGLGR